MAIFPPPLKKGGTIGVVAPARRPDPLWIEKGKAVLEKKGYRFVVHPQVSLKDGRFAGPDKARAKALGDMFADPKIDAIICARGGTGTMRMLDLVDYATIKKHPKPIVGYSDMTVLLQAIRKKCGFVTYHGPMMNFTHRHTTKTLNEMLAVISGEESTLSVKAKCARTGKAEGTLIGGNITLLQAIIGTPYDWSGKDAILFLEDIDEELYRLDRTLRHFKLAGKFEGVRAVIVGEMIDVRDGDKGDPPYGRSLRQIFEDVLPPKTPLCFDFPCGHGTYLTTLPVGARAQVSIAKSGVKLKFKP